MEVILQWMKRALTERLVRLQKDELKRRTGSDFSDRLHEIASISAYDTGQSMTKRFNLRHGWRSHSVPIK